MKPFNRIAVGLVLLAAFAIDHWLGLAGTAALAVFTVALPLRNDTRDAYDVFDSGTLEIRTGAPPGPGEAPTGTVLATITLPADAFTPTDGLLTLAGTWQDASADATGTAGHWRMVQSGDAGTQNNTDERLEGTITGTGGGGDMELDNTSIASGQQVTVSAFTITFPAS